jgi:hypothetical protein
MPKKLTIQEFKEKANKKHNNRYDYSKTIYSGINEKLMIVCPIHGGFLQQPRRHLNGNGCKECSSNESRLQIDDFINRAKLKHNDRYDYSKVKYINSKTKVIIICPIHGDFGQRPDSHLAGAGCSTCVQISRRNDVAEFIKNANEKYNNFYDYSKVVYISGHTKIIIICPEHGEFYQTPDNHLKHCGCIKCSSRIQTSKMSDAWLTTLGIDTLIPEYRIPENLKRPVDGYDPVTNTIYQFHGDYFHGNPLKFKPTEYNELLKMTHGELYEKTCKIDQEIQEFGYNLVVMWEYDWLKICNN